MALYEHILKLQKQGTKSAEIALQLGVTQRTIHGGSLRETSLTLVPDGNERVCLIHTNPISWSAATRVVAMEHNWKEN